MRKPILLGLSQETNYLENTSRALRGFPRGGVLGFPWVGVTISPLSPASYFQESSMGTGSVN
jgi:hypothetical protein